LTRAFTLIELSIVLVIIGIIVAGISGGSALIHQAQLNALISEKSKHDTSINTFKLKYDQLPGDFDEATEYWPSANTVDGNNDNIIGYSSGSNFFDFEVMSAWEHLSLAGVTSGSYDREGDGLFLPVYDPGLNIPSAAIESVVADPFISGPTGWVLSFGSLRLITPSRLPPQSYQFVIGPSLSPIDMQQIDRKIDDGLPESGDARAEWCISQGEYVKSDDSVTCRVYFPGYGVNPFIN